MPYEARIEDIAPAERRRLAQNALIVLPVGAVILTVLFFIMFKTGETFGPMKWLGGIFFLFFFGVLFFIFYVHIRNAFSRKKKVMTGRITNKQLNVMQLGNRNSSGNPTYQVYLEGEPFLLEHFLYQQLHTGDLAELHQVIGTGNIFQVKVLERPTETGAAPAAENQAPPRSAALHSDIAEVLGSFDETLSESERGFLRRHLFKAIFWRGILGGALCAFVYAVLLVFSALLIYQVMGDSGTHPEIRYVLVLPFIIAIGLFVLLNRYTFRLWLDLRKGTKRVSSEKVLDRVTTNTPIIRRNIIVTGTGQAGSYAYLDTGKHWLTVAPEWAQHVQVGEQVLVHLAPSSGLVLSVSKASDAGTFSDEKR